MRASKSILNIKTLLLALFIFPTALSYAQTLSKDAKVSLITVSPGEELYSSFGHNALWVSDPNLNIDRVYNYGTFDFRTDNFYVKFLRGTLPYQLSVSPIYNTIYGAQYENRSVTEQILNFSPIQKQRIFDFLENNYLPPNRQYAYKFFYDNCATRLRDAIQVAGGDSLRFDSQTVASDTVPKSYRQWMNKYLKEKPWSRYGMNLAIGLPSDHIATTQEEMYLPDNLKVHVERAKIGTQELVLGNRDLFTKTPQKIALSWQDILFDPQTIFFLIGIFTILFTNWQNKNLKKSLGFDKFIFGIVGLAGWLLLLLWIGTDHGVTAWNPDLLWIFPVHLPLIFLLKNKVQKSWIKYYLNATLLLILAAFLIGCITLYLQKPYIIGLQAWWLMLGMIMRLNRLKAVLVVKK